MNLWDELRKAQLNMMRYPLGSVERLMYWLDVQQLKERLTTVIVSAQ